MDSLLQLLHDNELRLQDIHYQKRTYVICATAVFSDPKAIHDVPINLIDEVLLVHVIRSGEEYIEYIPSKAITIKFKHFIKTLYPDYILESIVELDGDQLQKLDTLYEQLGISPIQRKI